jgi:acyl-CoA synthetase (AMP-forming)/AMP-acid ligase II
MLQRALGLFPSKHSTFFRDAPSLHTQKRSFFRGIGQGNFPIGEIYHALINQAPHHPISCNFITQIVDYWAEQPNRIALRCVDEANHQTLDITYSPDGRYYLTGDWATYRPDGLFTYLGRKDDLIKSRGYRIGPDEVEKAGMSHPAVAKIAVIGVHTEIDSHAITVKAFILLKPGYTESPTLIQEIQAHIKQETGPYKYPRLVEILTLEEWEKYETISGKIRRAGLREREETKLMAEAHQVDHPLFTLRP